MTAPILPIAQYAARSKDDDVLRVSSSGGVFTEIARVILSKKGVVVAAGWNRSTMTVEHRCVESENELADLRGSKYVTSDMSGVYKPMERFVSEGREVLFVGTPCQVAAVRLRFGTRQNLTLCAVVCHSNVPADVLMLYLQEIEKRVKSRVLDVRFRDKRDGWSKSSFCIDFANQALSLRAPAYDNEYARFFFSGLATKAACFDCRFRAGHSKADLVIGDFWGIDDVLPYLSDDKGISVALAYSQQGKLLLRASKLTLKEVTYQQAIAKNKFIEVSPTTDMAKRARFQRFYRSRGLYRAMRYAEFGPLPMEILVRGYRFMRRVSGRILGVFR